jgi:hypothetical protein
VRLLTAIGLVLAIAAGCGDGAPRTEPAAPPSPAPSDAPASPPAVPSLEAPAEPPGVPADPPAAPADVPETPAPDGAAATGETAPPDAAALELVVRAWSRALNAGDNEAAAALFAPGAIVVQGGVAYELETREQAVAWNATLPCSGRIVEIVVRGGIVGAVFELGDRPASACDAPAGTLAAALFAIEDGLITVWSQVAPEDVTSGAPPPETDRQPGPPVGDLPDEPVA